MESAYRLTAIPLAAGSSRRFGGRKLLHPFSDGAPIGIHSARTLSTVLANTIAVVSADDVALVKRFVDQGLEVVINSEADTGMASSLVAGVQASKDSDGWLIMLADMPWVRQQTIQTLVDQLVAGASLVAPVYQGRRGNPVGFSAKWFDALSGLKGDTGARQLLRQNSHELFLLEVEDPGVLKDVDYPDDLE